MPLTACFLKRELHALNLLSDLCLLCDCTVVDTTIAELIKAITDSDDFMSSLAVEQGTILL